MVAANLDCQIHPGMCQEGCGIGKQVDVQGDDGNLPCKGHRSRQAAANRSAY